MLDLSNPYTIAVIIAVVATVIFHFDQKQKRVEVETISYVKVFSLVLIAIVVFNYFTSSPSAIIDTVKTVAESVSKPEPVVSSVINNGYPFANLKIKEGPPDF
jgi:hypothetical protein